MADFTIPNSNGEPEPDVIPFESLDQTSAGKIWRILQRQGAPTQPSKEPSKYRRLYNLLVTNRRRRSMNG